MLQTMKTTHLITGAENGGVVFKSYRPQPNWSWDSPGGPAAAVCRPGRTHLWRRRARCGFISDAHPAARAAFSWRRGPNSSAGARSRTTARSSVNAPTGQCERS